MIFITGPLLAGKQSYICAALGLSLDEFARRAVWDVQELAAKEPDLPALAEALLRCSSSPGFMERVSHVNVEKVQRIFDIRQTHRLLAEYYRRAAEES